jgi:hypothetical protein
MRLVIFSDVDMEPMTVVNVPLDLMERCKRGGFIRMMPRPNPLNFWTMPIDEAMSLFFQPVTIRLEQLQRWDGERVWIGVAGDDALTVMSTLLPGQMADYQWEYA